MFITITHNTQHVTAIVRNCSVVAQVRSCQDHKHPKRHRKRPSQKKRKESCRRLAKKRPAFELKDQHGNTHTLADYKGKVVVLEWFNEGCPFCKGVWDSRVCSKTHYGSQESLKTPMRQPRLFTLAMNSTANRPVEEVLKSGAEFIEEFRSRNSNVNGLRR